MQLYIQHQFSVGLLNQQLLYYDEYYYYLTEALNMIY